MAGPIDRSSTPAAIPRSCSSAINATRNSTFPSCLTPTPPPAPPLSRTDPPRQIKTQQIDAMFREKFPQDTYGVETIPGMNEVYVSGPPKGGSSDAVFTTRHTDGPWALLPFCSAYRCILGLDSSAVYTTVFPNVPGRTTTCREGDLVCFDYHREIHYIEEYAEAKREQASLDPARGGDGFRIVLKVGE